MTGIEFINEDIVSTLIPIFSMRPAVVYLFYEKKHEQLVRSVSKAVRLKAHGIERIFKCLVDGDSLPDIEKKLRAVMDGLQGEVYVELTGGSELMNVCGYKLGREYGARLLHTDFDRMKITEVLTDDVVCDAVNVSLNDYITAIGAKRLYNSHHVPKKADFSRIVSMAEYLFSRVLTWRLTHQAIKDCLSDRLDCLPKERFTGSGAAQIMAEFVRHGFLLDRGEYYDYADSPAREYVTIFGVWLEMYVYIKLTEAYGRTDIGVRIDWDAWDGNDVGENEIDVIMMYKSVPVFVSCKMRSIKPADIYEVGFLAERLGGKRAKAFIATTAGLKRPSILYDKMNDLHVACVSTAELKKRPAKELFDSKLAELGVEL